jgi:hypothetical protein
MPRCVRLDDGDGPARSQLATGGWPVPQRGNRRNRDWWVHVGPGLMLRNIDTIPAVCYGDASNIWFGKQTE